MWGSKIMQAVSQSERRVAAQVDTLSRAIMAQFVALGRAVDEGLRQVGVLCGTMEDVEAALVRLEALHRSGLANQVEVLAADLHRIEGKVDAVLQHETIARNEQKVVRKRLPQPTATTMTGLPGPGRRADARAPEAALGSNGAAPMPKKPSAVIDPPLPSDPYPVTEDDALVAPEPRVSYITVAQASLRHDVDQMKVKRAARVGAIVGAKKESNRVGWQLPSDAVDEWARNL